MGPRMFKDGKEFSDYEGNRSSASLVDFAKQHEILKGTGWWDGGY